MKKLLLTLGFALSCVTLYPMQLMQQEINGCSDPCVALIVEDGPRADARRLAEGQRFVHESDVNFGKRKIKGYMLKIAAKLHGEVQEAWDAIQADHESSDLRKAFDIAMLEYRGALARVMKARFSAQRLASSDKSEKMAIRAQQDRFDALAKTQTYCGSYAYLAAQRRNR